MGTKRRPPVLAVEDEVRVGIQPRDSLGGQAGVGAHPDRVRESERWATALGNSCWATLSSSRVAPLLAPGGGLEADAGVLGLRALNSPRSREAR